MIKRGKATAKQFIEDARVVGRSIRDVVTGKPKPVSPAGKAQAKSMLGAGGLTGAGRNRARDAYLADATGTTPKPKPRSR